MLVTSVSPMSDKVSDKIDHLHHNRSLSVSICDNLKLMICDQCDKDVQDRGYKEALFWLTLSDEDSPKDCVSQGFQTKTRPICYHCAAKLLIEVKNILEGTYRVELRP